MHLNRWTVILGLTVAATAQAAGTVQVDFVAPTQYVDAGKTRTEEQTNRDAIQRHLEALGQRYLATGDTLKISVLDVDLAGNVKPARNAALGEVRTTRGNADYPRIKLRYEVMSGDKVVQSGEETITDMSYLQRATDFGSSDPLRYEKRMLSDWFKARLVEHKPAPR